MRTRILAAAAALAALFLFAFPAGVARAEDGVVHDQSDVVLEFNTVHQYVMANDFVVASTTRLHRATLFLRDGPIAPKDGVLNTFGGTMAWAIHPNAIYDEPGIAVASGFSRALEVRDTGLDDGPSEVFAVTFDFEPAVVLAPGTWWLSLREGQLTGDGDGTEVGFMLASAVQGSTLRWRIPNDDHWNGGSLDNAFVLYGERFAWHQREPAADVGDPITSQVLAADFTLAEPASVSAAEVVLVDSVVDDDGELDALEGGIGWAIYAAEEVEGGPGELLFSGTDSAPGLVDTGEQDLSDADIVRARVRFGRSLPLPAGHSWLALREGPWGTAAGTGEVKWLRAAPVVGSASQSCSDLASPHDWGVESGDQAFSLVEDLVFASGFEGGTTCTWAAAAGGRCPFADTLP